MKRTRTLKAKKGPATKKARTTRSSTAITQLPKWADELKYTYYAASTTADYNGLGVSVWTNVTRGDAGKDQFDGSVLHPKSLTITVQCVLADTTNMVRFVVAQGIRGAMPTATQLFQSTANVRAPLTTFDRAYKSSVNILLDELFQLDASHIARVSKHYVKGYKLQDVYWTTTGALAITSGDIAVYYISDSAAATHPSFNYAVETTFTD